MENSTITEIRENFRKELDVIFESIASLGRDTTDKILACGGTREDILDINRDYIDRGLLWFNEYKSAFKITESELLTLNEV